MRKFVFEGYAIAWAEAESGTYDRVQHLRHYVHSSIFKIFLTDNCTISKKRKISLLIVIEVQDK